MDYRSPLELNRKLISRLRHWLGNNTPDWFHEGHLVLLGAAVTLVGTLLIVTPDAAEATRHSSLALALPALPETTPAAAAEDAALALSAIQLDSADVAALVTSPEDAGWQEITVRNGDSLAQIFDRAGLTGAQLQAVLDSGPAARQLTNIHPGNTLRVRTGDGGELQGLVYQIDPTDSIEVTRDGDGFNVTNIHRVPDRVVTYSTGTIDTSLFVNAQRAGLSDNLTMALAEIFGYDIDFALDIRVGDRFTVLYEEYYLDGEKIRDGGIVAAEFVNQDRTYQAVRYSNEQGESQYYSPDGKAVRKAFLRTPVEFTRISSGFSLGRMHPVLNKIRAHRGVDYAAPRGTPVRATGNGRIKFRGIKGGYGKTIVVQHNNRYETLYAHLNSYARGISNGSRVRQGQIVGYVGSTGLATGPHLHYEFRVAGVHRNPLTIKLPVSEPLPAKYRADFDSKARALVAQIERVKRTTVAHRNL